MVQDANEYRTSGEGIIRRIRDGDGKEDPGAEDKRLMICATELAGVFAKKGRQGNTISDTLRDAFDGGPLSNPTRNNPERATDYALALIAHVTREELRDLMDAVDVSNGFLNRFLFAWCQAKRSISRPQPIPAKAREEIVKNIREAVDFARKAGELVWSDDAQEAWDSIRHPGTGL